MSLKSAFVTPPSSNRQDDGQRSKLSLAIAGSSPAGGVNLFEGVEDKHVLKAVFLAGSGGSGKGAVRDAMFKGTGFKVIDSDKHLERFLKDAGIPLKDAGASYSTFKRAQELKGRELRHYAQRRLPLLIDSTGWDYERIARPAKKLRRLGYDVYMVYVSTSLETALARNKERAAQGGREVPDSFITTAWHGVRRNLQSYKRLFGTRNFLEVENDANVSPKAWERVVSVGLRKQANRILARPLENPKGIEWLAKERENPTLDDPNRQNEWPEPQKAPKLSKKFVNFAHTSSPASAKLSTRGAEPLGAKVGSQAAKMGSVKIKQGKFSVSLGKSALAKAEKRPLSASFVDTVSRTTPVHEG